MPIDPLTRIEAWLAANAPRILHESLNPGASEEALAALETAVGRPLPEDFKLLYRRFDGMDEEADHLGSFFYGMRFRPLAEVENGVGYRKFEPEFPLRWVSSGINASNILHPDWLQIGFDGSHTWLCVDLAPAGTGTYGQVIFVDEEQAIAFCVADSVASLLRDFADDLEQGRYTLDPDALGDGEQFLSPDTSIDVVNWWQASRWQSAAQS